MFFQAAVLLLCVFLTCCGSASHPGAKACAPQLLLRLQHKQAHDRSPKICAFTLLLHPPRAEAAAEAAAVRRALTTRETIHGLKKIVLVHKIKHFSAAWLILNTELGDLSDSMDTCVKKKKYSGTATKYLYSVTSSLCCYSGCPHVESLFASLV